MKRRKALGLAAGALGLPALPAGAAAEVTSGSDGQKVLRVVFPVAETGFDPARVQDLYSRTVTAHIFDAPYEFDHLARPVKLRPRTALAMPEASEDFRTWTVKLRPGIYFAPDEAFKGANGQSVRRELVAQDYVYTFKRFADPATKSISWSSIEELGIAGLAELREKALKNKTPFDYDSPIEGLRTLDRHTLQVRLTQPNPRFAEKGLANSGWVGAFAREVVEHYGDKVMEHPVGTGPFMLTKWRRSSQMVLERNPNYREVLWDAEPAADDIEGQAILKQLKGRRVPLVDRVEVAIIEEAQPRYLSFLNGQVDLLALPQEFVPTATPGGVLAPHLRKRNIRSWRVLMPYTVFTMFNMDDATLGGLEPHRIALRRALGLGTNCERMNRLAFRGQAVPAESIIPPYCSGYRSDFHSEVGEYNPAKARALLDLYGYVDRNGDGWRENPDGSPLVLKSATQPDGLSRQINELTQKDYDALGVRIEFVTAKWPENLKAARAGKLMMWLLVTSATNTDGQDTLGRLYGPEVGQANLARFKLPAFDQVYDQLRPAPDGPEREALFDKAKRIAIAYAPYKPLLHQYTDLLAHPWLSGYRRPIFWNDWWHMVDIDTSRRPPTA